jgi:thioredoxin-like negative regulator of GroEL
MEHVAHSLADLEARIAELDAAILYFNEPSCRVGAAVETKVLELLAAEFPRVDVVHVDTVAVPDAAAQFGALTVPTLVVTFAGREVKRFVRTFGIDEVRAAIERPYSVMFG